MAMVFIIGNKKVDPREILVDIEVPPGLGLDELTDTFIRDLTRITDQAEPHVRAQAEALRDEIRYVAFKHFRRARRSDRLALARDLEGQGLRDIAHFVRTERMDF
jgi:hypothetical protein